MPANQLLSTDPKAGRLLSTDASAGTADKAVGTHPEAVLRAPTDAEPVTLGELIDNPVEAIGRIGSILRKDASDPKTWLTLATAYFGPKVVGMAMPAMGNALRGALPTRATVGKGLSVVGGALESPIGGVLSPRAPHVGRMISAAGEQMQATPNVAPSAPGASTGPLPQQPGPVRPPIQMVPPVEPAPIATPNAPIPVGRVHAIQRAQRIPFSEAARLAQEEANAAATTAPVAAAPPEPPARVVTPIAKFNPSEAMTAVRQTFSALKETPQKAEINNAMELLRRGFSPTEAVERVIANRPKASTMSAVEALAAKLGTPTTADMESALRERNATGRWKK